MSDQDTGQGPETIANALFLEERDQPVEDTVLYTTGPTLCTFMTRLIRVADMFEPGHNQIDVAARECAEWLHEKFEAHNAERFQLQLTEKNIFFNGQLLKLDVRAFERTGPMRATFLQRSINQITFDRGIGPGELVELTQMLHAAEEAGEAAALALQSFDQPHLRLESVVDDDLEIPEVDERRDIIELYAGLLVKTSTYFDRIRRRTSPSAKDVKRLVQRVCEELDDHADVFIGLINLRLIEGQDFVHAVNTAIYAMLLARQVGLGRLDIVRCGMTALTQDIEKIGDADLTETSYETGDEAHFTTNLSSVIALSQVSAGDMLSALRMVTSYERGFPYNKPMPKAWYREELTPHLLSRIIEIARHYDVLTQGLEGVEARPPDRALQTLMGRMGSHYDPHLLKLFVNTIGIYPVGSVVELSTGEQALVVKSPALITSQGLSEANRPVLKLLDGSERIVDLAQEQHAGTRILRIVERTEINDPPGAFLLF